VVSFTPRPLYPQGKSPWYPFDRTLVGPQSRSGRGGEEKNSQSPPGIEPQENRVGRCGLDICGSGKRPVAGCCEQGNELLVPQKAGNFLTS
jgi:hypothetical protein